MRTLSACLVSFAGAWGVLACSEGASSDPALGSQLRVVGAQFVPGATPAAQAGPEVAALDLLSSTIWPGYADKPLRGTLGVSATAAALALSGDTGYWVVPAGVPDVSAPTLPTFRALASFSTSLRAGAYTFEVRAVDERGRFGAPLRQLLSALPIAPSRSGAGQLRVTLTWDSEADVDLHVVDPLENEIYHGDPSSRDAFAGASDDASYGTLDVDSNANCDNDGLRQEDVVWAQAPPSGHYLVRVDTSSLCGSPAARWNVSVTLHDAPLAAASGIALDSDTRGAHDRGAGVLALEFDVP